MNSLSGMMAVLAFSTTVQLPDPPPAPPLIPNEVERVQQQYGVEPLPAPLPGVDPVTAGMIPADLEAERRKVEAEAKAKVKAQFPDLVIEKIKMWPVSNPPRHPAEEVDLTLTSPPVTCTKDFEGMRYYDAKLRAGCTCKGGSWGC